MMGNRVVFLTAAFVLFSLIGPVAVYSAPEASFHTGANTPFTGNVNITSDWVVSGTEVFINSTICLDGNLTIDPGGSLTLVNTTLTMNLTGDGEHWIKVEGTMVLNDLDGDPSTAADAARMRSNDTEYSYSLEAKDGSTLDFNNSIVEQCGFSPSYKGVVVKTGDAWFGGMNFTSNYYGLSLAKDGAMVRNCSFFDNYLGVEMSFSECGFDNNVVNGSQTYGLYLYGSSSEIINSTFESNGDSVYARYSESLIESCEITDSVNWGLNLYSSNPLVVNSTLSNTNEMRAVKDSFPRFLNTTFNESRVSIGFGLHASVGQFVDVRVEDGGGSPLYNMTVAVVDDGGNPASSGVTDISGTVIGLCYRERFLVSGGTIEFPSHRVMAFGINGTTWFGENLTTLGGGDCTVICQSNPLGLVLWEGDRDIVGNESYVQKTIITMGNLNVDLGGHLNLDRTELMFFTGPANPLALGALEGLITISDSSLHAIGTDGLLRPARSHVTVFSEVTFNVDSTDFGWVDKVEVFTSSAHIRNVSFHHADTCGIEIGNQNDPLVENVTVDWGKNGINLASAKGNVTNVTVTNVRNYGLYAPQARSVVMNYSVLGASKGIYALSSTLDLSDFDLRDCSYGIHSLYSVLDIRESIIHSSGTYGIFSSGGGLSVSHSDIVSSSTGVHLQDSDLVHEFEQCDVSGNSIGMSLDECHPTILNSSLDNPTDLNVRRATSAALVNSTFGPSNLTIQPSAYVDVGDWVFVTVLNQSVPVTGSKVAITDSAGEVSDSRVTGINGRTGPMAFRGERLFWNRSQVHGMHTVWAYSTENGSHVGGGNLTALTAGEHVVINMTQAGGDWVIWPDGHTPVLDETHTGKMIIAEGDVHIDEGVTVNLTNTTLWVWGEDGKLITVDGKWLVNGSAMAPMGTASVFRSNGFGLALQAQSEGMVLGSQLSNLDEMVTFTDDLTISDSTLTRFRAGGLRVEAADPSIVNSTFSLCYDGLSSYAGHPAINGSMFLENGAYGAYAESGAPVILGSTFAGNDNGIGVFGESEGLLNGCSFTGNRNGIYIVGSSPAVENTEVYENTNYGVYCMSSYAVLTGSELHHNNYGLYCRNSAPELFDTNITSNTFGVYAHTSGPYISDCRIEANAFGIYAVNDARDLELTAFASDRESEVVTFVTGGSHTGYSIRLPKRALPKSAQMKVSGIEVRNEAVREDAYWQVYPNIHDDLVVWQDNRDSNWEIYVYNLSMDSDGNGVPNYLETPQLENDPALIRITYNPGVQVQPDIWEDIVVWADLESQDVWAYTFTNDTTWAVTDHPDTQWRPAVHGDHIVYTDDRNGHNDIYMANISTGEVSRLSNSTRDDMGAKIDDGKVVWYSYKGAPGQDEFSDIYLFDIPTWQLRNVTDDIPLQYSPDVFGDNIVWHDNRHVNWEIFRYNITGATEERLTNEKEQSFAPRIHGERVVYYYHDRINDVWAARMYDLGAGAQTELEARTYGDSQPVVYGDRVAWVNKSNAMMDIYVLDFNIIGYPHNVTLDVGNDGDLEFQRSGQYDGSEYLNGSLLLDEIRQGLPGMGGGTVDIPLNVTFDDTGRFGLDFLSVVYDLPTIIVNSTVNNNSNSGAYCHGSTPRFVNSTVTGNPCDFNIHSTGHPVSLNSTFSESNLNFNGALANLTVQNFLHLRTENLTGAPLNASFEVFDNGELVHEGALGPDGEQRWIVVTDATHNLTGKHENETVVDVALGITKFNDDPRNVDMCCSHWEVFSTYNPGPVASRAFPYPDWPHTTLYPTISVWVTDDMAVDPASMRLYVQGFSVFYTAVPVPGGYNVSYYHVAGFGQGETVTCRVVAEDHYGNALDYSWSFHIDTAAPTYTIPLQTGWNLVSIPIQPANTTLECVLMSISGLYDQVQHYDRFTGWRTYSAYRPAILNDLADIDHTMGIWIHATANCTLVLTGTPPIFTSIPLYAGWNLVGYPTLNNTTSIGDALWGTSADRVEGFDPDSPYNIKELEPTYIMRPGEGYWVHVPADTMWVIDW